jgi:hypothetical protein
MRRLDIAALLSGLVLAPAFAGAQQSLPETLSRDTRDSLHAIIGQSAAARLPTEPLFAKAAEGVLKRATDARILAAVRSLAHALADARAQLPNGAAAGTVVAAASAIQAGVDLGVIARYAAVSKGSDADLAVAYVTLADLIASSVPIGAATASVERLLRTGVADSELAAFRAAIARDIQNGSRPEEALKARLGGMGIGAGRPQ